MGCVRINVYTSDMTIMPIHDRGAVYALTPSPLDQALESARAGHVAWLTEQEREVVAVLPANLAHAALEALEENEEDRQAAALWPCIEESRARRAAGEKGTPLAVLKAEAEAELTT